MAAVRHLKYQKLEFLTATVQKFGCNRRSNFDSIQFFNILRVKLENAYLRAKIGVLGVFYPKMGSNINETPKRHILGRKHVV